VIPELRKQRQENLKTEASLGYTESCKASLGYIERHCLKNKKNNNFFLKIRNCNLLYHGLEKDLAESFSLFKCQYRFTPKVRPP
jgi:hypothetical protein